MSDYSTNPKITSISSLESISAQVGLVDGQAVDPRNDVVIVVTGAGSYPAPNHQKPQTLRSTFDSLPWIYSGRNVGAGTGIFDRQVIYDNGATVSYGLAMKSLLPFDPIRIEESEKGDHLKFYLDQNLQQSGLYGPWGAEVFHKSDKEAFYFNTVTGTGVLQSQYHKSDSYIVIDTMPEKFEVIDASPYFMRFEEDTSYVVDSAITNLELHLEGGLNSSVSNKNGRTAFIAAPETCIEITLLEADGKNISERMNPGQMNKGSWNYVHLHYTSGVNGRYLNPLGDITEWNAEKDKFVMGEYVGIGTKSPYDTSNIVLTEKVAQNRVQRHPTTLARLIPELQHVKYTTYGSQIINQVPCFDTWSQSVEPLIFYSIYI